ncbi:rhamnogalacturonan acetylesterase [Actinoplanes sp. NPDC049599]|uniref:rhamnogalacturonan acetylesterase n=1 Tax=Actinoplanes sp. NPDC049599 TaxID=3363903 RepID=UPI0037B939AB
MTIDRRTLLRATAAGVLVGWPGIATPARAAQARPRIHVVGDSTAASYAVTEIPRAGWGQALPLFLAPGTEVVNAAVSASSTKSFADLGRLDGTLAALRPGDVLLISFGHADESELPSRHTEPWTTFQEYLFRYVESACAAQALPVLVTPVERRRFTPDGRAFPSHGDYPAAMREVARVSRTPLIDLTALSFALFEALGPEATKDLFLWLNPGDSAKFPDGVADDTHLQARGAIEVARLVVTAGWMLPGRDRWALMEPDLPADQLVWLPTRPGPDPL